MSGYFSYVSCLSCCQYHLTYQFCRYSVFHTPSLPSLSVIPTIVFPWSQSEASVQTPRRLDHRRPSPNGGSCPASCLAYPADGPCFVADSRNPYCLSLTQHLWTGPCQKEQPESGSTSTSTGSSLAGSSSSSSSSRSTSTKIPRCSLSALPQDARSLSPRKSHFPSSVALF
ncbi:uncharacterized protein BO87DRAFT_378231 [Aspergillus neoniger CBS 115656]|uniref:Uncharacterized protein n=1 Tax=Aspergillus neoniger (strain CBS 115656) TaxID=1448310 RepID=A0A318YE84_ASPNB|nr:hypothetical protein BO87DRAFT_378231 [Aspergillus neoniger CBS 115656]PYH32354.1 hypothetical protein BO87DRAFT_378231 [Aspergillus neoniger CBS 115656]